MVKGGSDKLLTTSMVTGSAALIAIILLPFLPASARSSWPLSLPDARHGALAGSRASVVFLQEALAPLAWLGVILICCGILGMTAGRRMRPGKGVALALLNAVVIASYTLIDGAGVRRSGAPPSYTLWIFLLTGAPFTLWTLAAKGQAFRRWSEGTGGFRQHRRGLHHRCRHYRSAIGLNLKHA